MQPVYRLTLRSAVGKGQTSSLLRGRSRWDQQKSVIGCLTRTSGHPRPFHTNTESEINDDGASEPSNSFASLRTPLDTFPRRHIGPDNESTHSMVKALDPPVESLDDFVREVLPEAIISSKELKIAGPDDSDTKGYTESRFLEMLWNKFKDQPEFRSYIGCGYANTRVPEVIKRNVLENPAWYTSYTPYQPEISQGRLESLLNFQTMVSDLTGLDIANASVLDESTAAAEAMTLSVNAMPAARQRRSEKVYFVSDTVHPQTLAVLQSRAEGFGISIVIGDVLANDSESIRKHGDSLVGVLVQYPDTKGDVKDFSAMSELVHKLGGTVSVATDLLALTLLKPPGEFGADVAFGNAQRFGVPFGYGGPHAAFFACSEKHKRKIPGRLVGMSKDRLGDPAVRLALQTREQHIRREKATSNICTAQALLANMSALYACYHGPAGLKRIAERVVNATRYLQYLLLKDGFVTSEEPVLFDTIVVEVDDASKTVKWVAENHRINLRVIDGKHIGITLDETVSTKDVQDVAIALKASKGSASNGSKPRFEGASEDILLGATPIPEQFARKSSYLTHPVFNTHHSETELLRYIYHLQSKDLSLVHSMIPLGSCTMKLNATSEMIPVTWPHIGNVHPFAPTEQASGYKWMIETLEKDLAEITGFHAVSLQPNSGAQGEFAGLRVIRKYHEDNGSANRDICLIPVSAHGTNPASAAMAGMRVVTIKCDGKTGNLDLEDLAAKCKKHEKELSAIMITYPSTFGVFEPAVKEACDIVHKHGGQVYMDGANMNAQIGLCSPGEIGADVCHLNLHKTFCIPHGGGGPGVGPIGVAKHLAPFLPGHPLVRTGGSKAIAPISGAPWGSASILPISLAYIKMMGARGLTHATKITLLNANYILSRLRPHYPILYTNAKGRCAHEFILDLRSFKESAGIEAIDVAKRLQDYGFHAPTMSWPVAGTLMIEPTESESQEELDRFCDAFIAIRKEIKEIEDGKVPKDGNVLKMAPHTTKDLLRDDWDRPYSREKAAFPLPYLEEKKFWPSVTRLDDAYGDMNLFCTCAPPETDSTIEGLTGAAAPAPT